MIFPDLAFAASALLAGLSLFAATLVTATVAVGASTRGSVSAASGEAVIRVDTPGPLGVLADRHA